MQLVSIILPAKNAFEFLDECIESILNQTYINWELIAVNDNSTDKTLSKLSSFAILDSRIIVLNSYGNGIIEALKTGYKMAKGELITRMDADDIMPPKKIETLAHLLIQSGKGFVATGLVKYFSANDLGAGYINYEKWLNQLCLKNFNFKEIYKECSIPSPCWMLWKENFNNCGGFESDIYPEDYDLAFRMYKNGLKVVGTDKILHYWRDSENRASRTDENYKDNRFLEIKTHYFIEIDYSIRQELFLWGAGKKGKEIAKILNRNKINFRWMCNSETKIGHRIYDILLENCSSIDLTNSQIIIAVANNQEQIKIQNSISKFKDVKYFYFC